MKLATIISNYILSEGVYDPSIFKAIFIVGGSGSGKSYIADKTTRGLGFKVVDSDVPFERMLKKNHVSMKMNDPDDGRRNALRARAKEVTDDTLHKYLTDRLGIIVSGTGWDYNAIAAKKQMLNNAGYDTYMIFVNTSLQTALDRNRNRERTIPDNIVSDKWTKVQQNIGKFQSLMGMNNMIIVDNEEGHTDQESLNKIWKEIMKFSKRPVQNYEAKKWIQQQLIHKNKLQRMPGGDGGYNEFN